MQALPVPRHQHRVRHGLSESEDAPKAPFRPPASAKRTFGTRIDANQTPQATPVAAGKASLLQRTHTQPAQQHNQKRPLAPPDYRQTLAVHQTDTAQSGYGKPSEALWHRPLNVTPSATVPPQSHKQHGTILPSAGSAQPARRTEDVSRLAASSSLSWSTGRSAQTRLPIWQEAQRQSQRTEDAEESHNTILSAANVTDETMNNVSHGETEALPPNTLDLMREDYDLPFEGLSVRAICEVATRRSFGGATPLASLPEHQPRQRMTISPLSSPRCIASDDLEMPAALDEDLFIDSDAFLFSS